MATFIDLDHGNLSGDGIEISGGTGATPRADTITIQPNETLASITERAYGANTSEYRSRILHANGNLDGATIGDIRAPR